MIQFQLSELSLPVPIYAISTRYLKATLVI